MPSCLGKLWVFATTIPTKEGITLAVKFNHRPQAVVRADGGGLAGHAGGRLLAELAEWSGLAAELSRALAPLAKPVWCHHAALGCWRGSPLPPPGSGPWTGVCPLSR